MENQPKPIRELMPPRFTRLIMAEVGKGSASGISEIVNTEKTSSSYWPYIEKLAIATDSKAYRARMKFLEQKRQLSNAA